VVGAGTEAAEAVVVVEAVQEEAVVVLACTGRGGGGAGGSVAAGDDVGEEVDVVEVDVGEGHSSASPGAEQEQLSNWFSGGGHYHHTCCRQALRPARVGCDA